MWDLVYSVANVKNGFQIIVREYHRGRLAYVSC